VLGRPPPGCAQMGRPNPARRRQRQGATCEATARDLGIEGHRPSRSNGDLWPTRRGVSSRTSGLQVASLGLRRGAGQCDEGGEIRSTRCGPLRRFVSRLNELVLERAQFGPELLGKDLNKHYPSA